MPRREHCDGRPPAPPSPAALDETVGRDRRDCRRRVRRTQSIVPPQGFTVGSSDSPNTVELVDRRDEAVEIHSDLRLTETGTS